ncbi:MAG: MotA/TolQ/ExbB proton channel family protein [Nitrosomonas sp.]|nr:MotA/TolQ/ExbB proton channel family protein [Nitrosomonas sp.]
MTDLIVELDKFIHAGGFVMPPLLLATALLWFGLGYRFWILRRKGKVSPRELIRTSLGAHADGKKPRDIVEEAAMIGVNIKRSGVADLRSCLDGAFHRYETEIGRYRPVINTIVMIAPLLGLLGTVNGMIETFDSLADMALFTQSGGIAGGISQALFTTQMGLAVAIPGFLAKSILDRKQRRIQAELNQIRDLLCIRAR